MKLPWLFSSGGPVFPTLSLPELHHAVLSAECDPVFANCLITVVQQLRDILSVLDLPDCLVCHLLQIPWLLCHPELHDKRLFPARYGPDEGFNLSYLIITDL